MARAGSMELYGLKLDYGMASQRRYGLLSCRLQLTPILMGRSFIQMVH